MSAEKIVTDFLGAWQKRNLDQIMAYFGEDAIYHNVPVDPIRGVTKIRNIFATFLEAFEEIDLELISIGGDSHLVFTERLDRFVMPNRRMVELPVAGVFEISERKIMRFSDYFDLAHFERQSGIKL